MSKNWIKRIFLEEKEGINEECRIVTSLLRRDEPLQVRRIFRRGKEYQTPLEGRDGSCEKFKLLVNK